MTQTATPSTDLLDEATITLIFALRDSLTDDGPSRIDFWSGGRAATALTTAAAGASTAAEALTIAAHKLQIPQISARQAKPVVDAMRIIDEDYEAWAAHIDRTIVYIIALADIQRQERQAKHPKAEKPADTPITTDQPLPF